MKVLFVHKDINFFTPAGGINTVYINLAYQLVSMGAQVGIITSVEPLERVSNIDIFVTKEQDKEKRKFEIIDIINEYNPDIVDSSSWGTELYEYSKMPNRKAIIFRADNPSHYYTNSNNFEKELELADKSDYVIFNSKWCENEWKNIKNKNTIIIPLGSTFHEFDINKKNDNCIIWVGKTSFEKGIDILLKLDDQIFKNYKVKCIFTTNRFTDFEMINMLKLKGAEIYENLTTKEYNKIISTGDYILNTSRIESFCLALLECMSYGLIPVIPNIKCGYNEFTNSNNSLIYNDIVEISNLLKQYNIDKKRAIKETCKIFTWENNAKSLIHLYEKIMKGKNI